MAVDTGMVVVIFISLMYMVLVFTLLFYVKNDWCDLLFKNMTVSKTSAYSVQLRKTIELIVQLEDQSISTTIHKLSNGF